MRGAFSLSCAPSSHPTQRLSPPPFDQQRGLKASYDHIEHSADLLRPVKAAEDVAADEDGPRRQIARTVFDSFTPQLDLSFAAAAYGLIGLFLGSLVGELLTAALFPRHRAAA